MDIILIFTWRYHNPAFSKPVVDEASNIHVALNHKFHTGTFWQVHSCIDPMYLWIKLSIKLLAHQQSTGLNRNINIANRTSENAAKLKCLVTILIKTLCTKILGANYLWGMPATIQSRLCCFPPVVCSGCLFQTFFPSDKYFESYARVEETIRE
jgi:hypothetical protein